MVDVMNFSVGGDTVRENIYGGIPEKGISILTQAEIAKNLVNVLETLGGTSIDNKDLPYILSDLYKEDNTTHDEFVDKNEALLSSMIKNGGIEDFLETLDLTYQNDFSAFFVKNKISKDSYLQVLKEIIDKSTDTSYFIENTSNMDKDGDGVMELSTNTIIHAIRFLTDRYALEQGDMEVNFDENKGKTQCEYKNENQYKYTEKYFHDNPDNLTDQELLYCYASFFEEFYVEKNKKPSKDDYVTQNNDMFDFNTDNMSDEEKNEVAQKLIQAGMIVYLSNNIDKFTSITFKYITEKLMSNSEL